MSSQRLAQKSLPFSMWLSPPFIVEGDAHKSAMYIYTCSIGAALSHPPPLEARQAALLLTHTWAGVTCMVKGHDDSSLHLMHLSSSSCLVLVVLHSSGRHIFSSP